VKKQRGYKMGGSVESAREAVFVRDDRLRRHEQRDYKCPACYSIFRTDAEYKRHWKEKHR
jgi:uncharacterized C2H2 Zn-finger protein